MRKLKDGRPKTEVENGFHLYEYSLGGDGTRIIHL
jgi:hypothetical protein